MEIIEMLEDYAGRVVVEEMSVYVAAREVPEELRIILSDLETLGYEVYYT